jgi:hypothetical protein
MNDQEFVVHEFGEIFEHFLPYPTYVRLVASTRPRRTSIILGNTVGIWITRITFQKI